MVKLVLQTADWDNLMGHNALATESNFLTANITAEFNRPAKATIILKDEDGSMARKYDVDTANDSIYIGPGRAYIYDDDDAGDACIFNGRIISAISDMTNHTLTLECTDWLSQMDDRRIDYDMREDIDGAGLRQSGFKSDITAGYDYIEPVETSGSTYYAYDDDMEWTKDQWNNYYLASTVDNAGVITASMGPHTVSTSGALDDNPAHSEVQYCWVDDDNALTAADDTAGTYYVYLWFKPLVHAGSLHTSTDEIRLDLTCSLVNANGSGNFFVLDTDDVTKYYIRTITSDTSEQKRTYDIRIPKSLFDDFLNSNGTVKVGFAIPVTGGTTATIKIFYAWYQQTETVSGYSSAITISDTDNAIYADFTKAYMYEAGVGYTDETTDLADTGAGDVQLLPNPLSQNDAFYFGADQEFDTMKLEISQAGDYDGTLRWEYYNGAWTALSDVTDNTSGFEAAPGTNTITWTMPSDWEQVAVNGTTKYWVRAAMITAAPVIRTTPLATEGWYVDHYNRLVLGTDLDITGLGCWEDFQYSICRQIYKHINTSNGGTLVTGGDDIYAMTASANIEATSGLSLRHYTGRTRLEILQDLSMQDKAVFWVPLGTAALTWKSTFNNGAPTAMTDASVLTWSQGRWDWNNVYNEYKVLGIRYGDYQVDETSSNGSSKTTYGIYRTKVLSNTGLLTDYDAAQLASKLVTRDKDAHLFLQAELGGLSSLRLGNEVSITSTYLGLTAAVYVVTHWRYDSKNYRTHIRLYPRTAASTIGFQESYDFTEVRSLEQIRDTSDSDRYIGGLTTQSW